MAELLFILGFTLHNIEEAIWLPGWSKHAGRYHREVSENEFRFAVIVVTAMGYLITFQYFLFSHVYPVSKYIFLGFVLMMVLNVIFPHIAASIVLKRYAPGTITGVLLNWPMGIYILSEGIKERSDPGYIIIAALIITAVFLFMIKLLFKAGGRLFDNRVKID